MFAIGFPMPELQGFSPKITKGVVSSINGIQDDISRYQIDAAIQPSNSGGPLADENGNIIGIIVARLNDSYVIKKTGGIAQNVNYAIKKSYVITFLKKHPDAGKQILNVSCKARKNVIPKRDGRRKRKFSFVHFVGFDCYGRG